MTETPLVSVVIGTYNSERFLQKTLDSVYSQTYENIEIVLLDDGSSDNTPLIIEKARKAENRVKVYYQQNQGLAGMRNRIYELAHGEWIAIIDSDDICYPNRIEEQLKVSCEYPEADLIFCNTDYIDENDNIIGAHLSKMPQFPNFIKKGDAAKYLLRYGCFVDSEAFFAKKTLIQQTGKLDAGIVYAADYDFFIRLGLNGNFAYTEKKLSAWRIHNFQMTKYCSNAIDKDNIKIYKKYFWNPCLDWFTRFIILLKIIRAYQIMLCHSVSTRCRDLSMKTTPS